MLRIAARRQILSRIQTLVFILVFMTLILHHESHAQDTDSSLIFTGIFGLQSYPEYQGSSETTLGLLLGLDVLYLNASFLSFGLADLPDDPLKYPEGLVPRLSFRYLPPRDTDRFSELEGLEDVDFSIESGIGVGFVIKDFEIFADIRYGVAGHQSFVGELTAFYVNHPNETLSLRVGPRALFGDNRYMNTYFGISEQEAARTEFDTYNPSAGLVNIGIEAILTKKLRGGLWLEFGAVYERLQSDAAASPIVRSGRADQFEFRIGLRRAYFLDF